jgi:hypothetical protein
MRTNVKHLVGRKIVSVDMRPFDDGKGGVAHNPLLILDNGRRLFFVAEETEVGEYGVQICITDCKKGGRL